MTDRDCKIKVWGVRGAFPIANTDFMEYGGNTACISADCGGRTVVFDAGTGLRQLGEELCRKGKKRIDILLSHLHMDHCLGLFSFRPMFDPEAEIRLYGGKGDTAGLRQSLETLLGAPYWPLGLQEFPARVEIHEIIPGESFALAGDGEAAGEGDLPEGPKIRTLAGNHPNQSLLYRLEYGGRSIVHALDCEAAGETFRALADFSREAALLIWDANFTGEDLKRCRGWGHSSWEQGIALKRAAGAGTVLMTHFAASYTDKFLREQERLARQTDSDSIFAREGMELSVLRSGAVEPGGVSG